MAQDPPHIENHIKVSAALIIQGDRIFIAQRPPHKAHALYWEFPGGKTEPGESPEECLRREIWEELRLRVHVGDLFKHVHYHHKDHHIDLYAYWCSIEQGELELREHEACYWARVDELQCFQFTQADRQVVGCLEGFHRLPYLGACH